MQARDTNVIQTGDINVSKVERRRDISAHIVLNCFQCVAYVFECNAVKMT